MFDLDISGNRCNGCEAKGREWEVSFLKFRPEGRYRQDPTIKDDSIPNNKYSITKLNEPSDPIRGTYKLFYKGNAISISNKEDIQYSASGG